MISKTQSKFKKGCLVSLIIGVLIIILFLGLGFFIYDGYRTAEIEYAISKKIEPEFNKIKKFNEFSNKEKRELSVKVFLLNECEGGEKRIDSLMQIDQNATSDACSRILKLNLIKNEIISSSKTELENLKYLNTINFGKALDNYTSFINE